MSDWTPTREAGLERMKAFVPGMGRAYAAGRNTDPGPGGAHAVSRLSPWVRRRLVREDELARAALEAHGPRAAEKFVQEVIWRTYWKGWLELRPQVWERYLVARHQARAAADRDPALARDLAAAEAGTTGIDAFDAWARELAETGWLHNHARMWFASIWIFTLKLPWALGADLFLRRLMDGDPASNTLSWRWVAGLQTVGKTYLATADNIARYTDGRFRPQGLARTAEPLTETEPVGAARPLRALADEAPAGPHLLLITPEDLTPEHLIGPWEIAGVALAEGPDAVGDGPARVFLEGALADAGARAAGRYGVEPARLATLDGAALAARARAVGAIGLVTPAVPVGPTATALAAAREALATEGLALVEVRRDWDTALWPLATKGFFPFKEKAPQVLAGLGLPV
ncbi:MAG TPA: FAD-binding domain-containing protein [Brevundimonas sp.]|jgi:deoxyribodipyrimidine photo-lyase|uniref:FAD-binding domain-containing protein n=1 Tax=Brevundimonas sp. TaxID=1871086 RepID=UPI002E0F0938|nr:FAD-binding domain-containing protein [Brevundimonas sp.]